jgi:hypothetical protein
MTPVVDTRELSEVKAALDADITDAGIGIYHLPSNCIFLAPTSKTIPPGHLALVARRGLDAADCRGFVIVKTPVGNFLAENFSGLNVNRAGSVGFRMAPVLFDEIERSLTAAGL